MSWTKSRSGVGILRHAGLLLLFGARASALSCVMACERIEHVSDFEVRQPLPPYKGACNFCPPTTDDLRRPPCPPSELVPTSSAEATYVFVARSLRLGADDDSENPAFDVGLDQDCSLRPTALPAWCIARAPLADDAGPPAIVASPWTALPHGIDNSLGQRVLRPLIAFAHSLGTTLDLDGDLSAQYEQGATGQLVIIDRWNGEPDDPAVIATFLGSSGTEVKPPRWDGTDVWTPNSDPFSYPHFDAYVKGGVLVADTRAIIEDDTQVPNPNGGAPFTLKGRLMIRLGAITTTELDLVTAGRWNLDDALSQSDAISDFLAGGDDGVATILKLNLPPLFNDAADLPLGEKPTAGSPCAAVSFAIATKSVRAQVGVAR